MERILIHFLFSVGVAVVAIPATAQQVGRGDVTSPSIGVGQNPYAVRALVVPRAATESGSWMRPDGRRLHGMGRVRARPAIAWSQARRVLASSRLVFGRRQAPRSSRLQLRPPLVARQIVGQVGFGLIGGVVGSVAGGMFGAGVWAVQAGQVRCSSASQQTAESQCSLEEGGLRAAFVIGAVLFEVFGTAGGVYMAGDTHEQTGDYWPTVIGSSTGAGVGLLGVLIWGLESIPGIASMLVLPSAAAAVGFNQSRRWRASGEPIGLFEYDDGSVQLSVPSVAVAPLLEGGGPVGTIQLATVRF